MMKYIIILLALGITPFLFSQERPTGDKEASDEVKRPERKPFPKHWGAPPRLQTRDIRPLPGGFGMGSSTLVAWIKTNIKADEEKGVKPPKVKPQPKPKPPQVKDHPLYEDCVDSLVSLGYNKTEARKVTKSILSPSMSSVNEFLEEAFKRK